MAAQRTQFALPCVGRKAWPSQAMVMAGSLPLEERAMLWPAFSAGAQPGYGFLRNCPACLCGSRGGREKPPWGVWQAGVLWLAPTGRTLNEGVFRRPGCAAKQPFKSRGSTRRLGLVHQHSGSWEVSTRGRSCNLLTVSMKTWGAPGTGRCWHHGHFHSLSVREMPALCFSGFAFLWGNQAPSVLLLLQGSLCWQRNPCGAPHHIFHGGPCEHKRWGTHGCHFRLASSGKGLAITKGCFGGGGRED